MKFTHLKPVFLGKLSAKAGQHACGECQNSCQSACKTSCTVGNQVCQK